MCTGLLSCFQLPCSAPHLPFRIRKRFPGRFELYLPARQRCLYPVSLAHVPGLLWAAFSFGRTRDIGDTRKRMHVQKLWQHNT